MSKIEDVEDAGGEDRVGSSSIRSKLHRWSCKCLRLRSVRRASSHLVEVLKFPVLLALFMMLGSVVLGSMGLGYYLFGWVGVVVGVVLSSSWVLVLVLRDFVRQLRILRITKGVEDGWRTPDRDYAEAMAYIVARAERERSKLIRV